MHFVIRADTLTISGAKIGAFVDGPGLDGPVNLPFSGRGIYLGPLEWLYATSYGSDTLVPGASETGAIIAPITLSADFGTNTISGCVGCNGYIRTGGVFNDPATGESYDGEGNDASALCLGTVPIRSDGTFQGRDLSFSGPGFTVRRTTGSRGGMFSRIPGGAGDPRLAAGTFAGDSTTTGGLHAVYVGTYYVTRQGNERQSPAGRGCGLSTLTEHLP